MRKEIPILFNTEMAQAHLNGDKSTTRRIITAQNSKSSSLFSELDFNQVLLVDGKNSRPPDQYLKVVRPYDNTVHRVFSKVEPGDVLWVRETFIDVAKESGGIGFLDEDEPLYIYKASHHRDDCPWTPSIHMPKAAARIWDEVIDVVPERIADITREECLKEGIVAFREDNHAPVKYGLPSWDKKDLCFTPQRAFKMLWNMIHGVPKPLMGKENGKYMITGYICQPFDEDAAAAFRGMTEWKGKPLTVIANPWVWAYSFQILSTTGRPAVLDEIQTISTT